MVHKMRFPYALVMALALAACPGLSVGAGDDEAKALYMDGVSLFKDAKYAEAAVAFKAAFKARPHWKIYYNIAQCEAALNRYGLALEAFERYLVDGGDDVPSERRQEVVEEIKQLRVLVGVIDVRAPDGVTVAVDGIERGVTPLAGPLRSAAGDREVILIRKDRVLLTKKVSVAGGMTSVVELGDTGEGGAEEQAAPGDEVADRASGAESKNPYKVLGWTAIGVGAAIAVGGAVTGGMALSLGNDLEGNCPGGECGPDQHEDVDKMNTLALTSDVLIGLGAAAAVAGAVLLIVDAASSDKEEDRPVALMVSPLGARFAWRY